MKHLCSILILLIASNGFTQTWWCDQVFNEKHRLEKTIAVLPLVLPLLIANGSSSSFAAESLYKPQRSIMADSLPFSPIHRVAEGLYHLESSTPQVVQQAWDSVFWFGSKYGWGTTFLAAKINKGQFHELYFLTNSHVASYLCDLRGDCFGAKLVQSPVGVLIDHKVTVVNKINRLEFDKVELIYDSVLWDLALMRVRTTLPPELLPSALQISQDCPMKTGDPQYLIGVPATYRRYLPENPERVQLLELKRWSYGIFVFAPSDEFDGSTVDAIPGNSGGPLINGDSGKVDGIINATYYTRNLMFNLRSWLSNVPFLALPEPKILYHGSERANARIPHARFINCSYVQEFLSRGLQNPLKP